MKEHPLLRPLHEAYALARKERIRHHQAFSIEAARFAGRGDPTLARIAVRAAISHGRTTRLGT